MATPIPVTFLILSAFFALLASPSTASNALFSDLGGGKLLTGKSLTYLQYTLTMQTDCNLVIYDQKKPIWATGTYGRGRDCYLSLDSTGELTIRHSKLKLLPEWSSKTNSTKGSYALVLQYDGTLQVYGPSKWSNLVSGKLSTSPKQTLPETTTDSVLYTGDVAPVGTTILNEKYKLVLQSDCNLIVTDKSNGGILWQTGTTDPNHLGDCYVTVDTFGQLYVKYMGGELLWTNNAKFDYGSYVLAIRTDGALGIYGPSIWSSGATSGAVAVSSDDVFGSSEGKIEMVAVE